MKNFSILLLTGLIGMFVGMMLNQNLIAGKKPMTRTILLQQDLTDMKGKEVIISAVEIAPNAKSPKHYHPAHVFGYVLEGSATLEYEDGTTENLKAGQAFYEMPNRSIIGRNTSTTKSNKAVVFIIKDKGKPAAVNVKEK